MNNSNKYFPLYTTSHLENIKFYLTGYATKKDLDDITHVDTSEFTLKTNLSVLKTEVDKLDIPKLSTIDLAKLSNVVKNDVVKKTDFNPLKTKVNSIDVSKYVLKTKYDSEVGDLKLKIPDVSGLLPTSTFNSKITKIEGKVTTAEDKIPDISGLATKASISILATKTELNNVLNKIPDISGYIKLSDYSSEITRIKNDYATKAILDSKLSELKIQHIADEVKKIDDKTKKNSTDIFGFESRLKQKEDTLNDLERTKV